MSVGTSSASHPEQVGDISHLSPRGHGQVADGASGTSFFSLLVGCDEGKI